LTHIICSKRISEINETVAIPTLHDWLLYSIEVGDHQVKIGFRAPESKETRFLIAEGIEDFLCNNMREGNIVLSVDFGLDYATDDALRRLLYLEPGAKSPAIEKLREQIETGSLQFASISPSYGASIELTAKSISIK